jgi:hypothetical protein
VSILWGKDKQLDYWAALQAGQVPDPERRAMGLLASMSDERRFSFYCLSGMFPAMGNVTKRMYMVRRWTTVLELEDGRPRASWCILAQDRQLAPETDHVVAMKNLLEGSELHFREVGNAFHYSTDPFRGNVDPKTSFPNPYHNEIGPKQTPAPAKSLGGDWNEDSALQFKELEGWIKTLRLKAELPTQADVAQSRRNAQRDSAAFRPWLLRDALLERAKDWVRIPPKERYKLPPTQFEEQTERARRLMNNIQISYGLGVSGTGVFTGTNNSATIFTNATTTTNAPFVLQQYPAFAQQAHIARTLA